MADGLRKRSITIRGHATSYSIEDEFHDELVKLAQNEGRSVAWLVAQIDSRRPEGRNLSSAIRVHVLESLRGR